MPIRVSPDEPRPTHHVSLSDGENEVGLIMCTSEMAANPYAISRAAVPRTAMKTTTGNQKYSDFEPPWSPIAQDSWGGGRGMLEFEKDVTRYADGFRANTMHEFIIPSVLPTYTTGLYSAFRHYPGSVRWAAVMNQTTYATRMTVAETFTAVQLQILARKIGVPASLTVQVCADAAGYPGTVLWSGALSTQITDWVSQWVAYSVSLSLTPTTFWLVVTGAGDQDNHWQIGYEDNGLAASCLSKVSGGSWVDSPVNMYYGITGAAPGRSTLFFQYRNQQYLISNDDAGGAPKIYQNGWRGAVSSAGGAVVNDSTKSWVPDECAGALFWVIKGAGSGDRVPYRSIVSNDATSLTLASAFSSALDTTTEYVIVGSNKWIEVTGHGLTKPVTSVMVTIDFVWFAQGDTTNIRRHRAYNNAGVFTQDWKDDGTNKAYKLKLVGESTGTKIWRGMNADADGDISVQAAPVPADWATNLAFVAGTQVKFKDSKGTINELEEYGDTNRYLWVFRDGAVFSMETSNGSTYAPVEMPLREMSALTRDTNGLAHLVHNVYMYFGLGPGIERFYQRTLDDVGPNRDEGFPADRQGYCSALAGYPGRYFAAYNAGAGYSSILCFNGVGWNEFYRAPLAGRTIGDMQFQALPPSIFSRLWVQMGADILWFPFSANSPDPTKDPAVPYFWESYVVSGWMAAGMVDIYKLLHSVKVFADNLQEGERWAEVDYQVDTDGDWIRMPDYFVTSPVSEIKFAGNGETAKRFRYRIRLLTSTCLLPPIVRTVVVETISRVPIKFSFSFPFRMKDEDVDLEGDIDGQSFEDKSALLDHWAAQLTPLTMRCIHTGFDGSTVFIDPASFTPAMEYSDGYVAKLTLVQV